MNENMNNMNENIILDYENICPHNDFCGGCIYQEKTYKEQLDIKEIMVKELLENKDIKYDKVEPIEPSPHIYKYRNKMEYTFGDLSKDGELTLGMHKKGNFMSIITVDKCQLVPPEFNQILRATLDFAIEKDYTKYHKKSHKGLLRNLIVRKGFRTNELLVNIVTASDCSPFSLPNINESNKNRYIFDETEFVQTIMNLKFQDSNVKVVGVLRTINDNLADKVTCEELKVLHGRDYYNEKILDLNFKVSAFSFFQTNIEAIENLYYTALSLPKDFGNKTVYDLFCGTGTISQELALKAKEVYGIEIIGEAVESAIENAKLNNLTNCHFIEGDVFKVLRDNTFNKPDMIVVDPPRMGIEPKALDEIIEFGVNEIVYVSCNPKTLVENLYYLQFHGYNVKYVKPFDNFPNTKHVECVVLMSKNK